jgi:predicted RNA-binding Zn-ribbon protein involved in translation (DUF1610 family)
MEVSMNDFVTLTCPSCGGKLQITNDIERFACGYCGLEHIVKRSGGVVSLAPIVDGLRNIQVGVDKTASELAIGRLEKELTTLSNQCQQIKSEGTPSSQTTGIVVGVVLSLVGIFSFSNGVNLSGIILIIIGTGLVFLLVRNIQHTNRKKQSKIAMVEKEIKEKQTELEKHRKNVTG